MELNPLWTLTRPWASAAKQGLVHSTFINSHATNLKSLGAVDSNQVSSNPLIVLSVETLFDLNWPKPHLNLTVARLAGLLQKAGRDIKLVAGHPEKIRPELETIWHAQATPKLGLALDLKAIESRMAFLQEFLGKAELYLDEDPLRLQIAVRNKIAATVRMPESLILGR